MEKIFEQFSYITLSALNEKHGVYLIQKNGENFVGKILTVYNVEVYEYLKNHLINNTPRIIEYFEQEINEQKVLLVVEEYIEGNDLSEILAKGVLDESEVIRIIKELLLIVERFHQAVPPIIHRDIKPSNIIINKNGKVNLLDMNAAKRQDKNQYQDTRLIGTAGYAAPEQYGFSASDVRTDIYSIGVLMNVMLTGKFPVERSYEGELGEIISKCTKLEPNERYQNTKELLLKLIGYEKTRKNIKPKKTKKKFYRALPPGFRKLNPVSIIFSTLGYAFMFAIGFSMEVTNSSGMIETWCSKISFMLSCIAVILFSANYLEIQNKLHITDIKNIVLRIIVIILIDCFLIFLIVLLSIIIRDILL